MKHAKATRIEKLPTHAGFTLVELITALTVVAVALAGLIAMFGISLETARESRMKTIAAELAVTQLAHLQATPESFLWKYEETNATALFPIVVSEDDPKAGNTVTPLPVKLVNRTIQARNELLYRKFRWKAWGRLTSPDAQAYEVTINVHWDMQGRNRSLALTSSIPRHHVPEPIDPEEGTFL